MVMREVSSVKNKAKRREVYAKVKVEKKRDKKTERIKRQKEAQELGEEAPPKQVRFGERTRTEIHECGGRRKSKMSILVPVPAWGRHGYPIFVFCIPAAGRKLRNGEGGY